MHNSRIACQASQKEAVDAHQSPPLLQGTFWVGVQLRCSETGGEEPVTRVCGVRRAAGHHCFPERCHGVLKPELTRHVIPSLHKLVIGADGKSQDAFRSQGYEL